MNSRNTMTRLPGPARLPAGILLFLTLVGAGCQSPDASEINRLREENQRLREALANASSGEVTLMPVQEFTVGLAAAEKSFDEAAFFTLLRASLREASVGEPTFTVAVEDDEQQIAKVRGMLVQQYLSEQKVPIRISNLTFKLTSADHDFNIGGTVVPRAAVQRENTADGLIHASFAGPIVGQMERDRQGVYSIAYTDSGGRSGRIPLTINDVEVFNPDQPPQVARQGDVSLNWQLSLQKIQVYRVNHFQGDVGKLMHRMRYPKMKVSIQQYQTIRDSVFLFGYGPYSTGLMNRLSTPTYIDSVEVVSVSPATFDALEPGITEREVAGILGQQPGAWMDCKFVEFSQTEKVWERPLTVGFPFVSRQTSKSKGVVFYAKYSPEGSVLIGDFPVRGSGL